MLQRGRLSDEEQMAAKKQALSDSGVFLDDLNQRAAQANTGMNELTRHVVEAERGREATGIPVDEADVLDIAWRGQRPMPPYSRADFVPPKVPRQADVAAVLGTSGRLTAAQWTADDDSAGPIPRRHFHAAYVHSHTSLPMNPRAFMTAGTGGIGMSSLFRQSGLSQDELWDILDKNGDGVITRDEWDSGVPNLQRSS